MSKKFRKATKRKKSYTSVKSEFLRVKTPLEENHLVALKDINIEVKPGSSLGVIGRNGSGKSTLLKLISRIYHSDSGEVDVSGRVSALIELGAGFHPDFTGRENVYLAGIMYGLSRAQIDQRFNEIVSFAELEDFIDDPVRTYSSGMYMRLGFSVAIHTNPDILLIDEVLAVGDVAFIHKCHDIISEFRRRGKTLIFVTHDLNSVSKWCDEAIWLDKGEIKLRGEPKRVIDAYLQGVEDKQLEDLQKQNVEGQNQRRDPFDKRHSDDKRWGDKQVELSRVRISCASEEPKWLFHTNDQVVVEVDYSINEPIEDLVFGVGIVRADGLDIHGNNTALDSVIVPLPDFDSCKSFPMHGSFSYSIDRLALLEGTYYLDVAAHRGDGLAYDYHHQLHKFSVSGDSKKSGVYLPKTAWKIEPAYQAASASGRGVVQSEVEAYKVRRA